MKGGERKGLGGLGCGIVYFMGRGLRVGGEGKTQNGSSPEGKREW